MNAPDSMQSDLALSRIRTQVMWNRLIAVVEEQAQTLIRTAFSASVREAGDLSAGVFDLHGRMVAQAVTGTPGHVNSMAVAVGHFLARYPVEQMQAGDHYLTNDPWLGTGHLHDFTLVSPTFYKNRPVALFASTVHVVDVGGRGFGPDGRFLTGMRGYPIHPLCIRPLAPSRKVPPTREFPDLRSTAALLGRGAAQPAIAGCERAWP